MTIDFSINELIEWKQEDGSGWIDRILWIDEGYIISYCIDIMNPNAFPVVRTIKDLQEAIENGDAQKLFKDPWIRLPKTGKSESRDEKRRDKAWSTISTIVEREPDIYIRSLRGSLVQQVVQELKVTSTTVYKLLRRYWQRGKNRNALLPDFDRCGGRGKFKAAGEKKRGRKRIYNDKDNIGLDKNIDGETREIFEKNITENYIGKKTSLKKVHELMINTNYANIEPRLRPTLDQFRYYYRSRRDIEEEIRGGDDPNEFELNHRPVTGTSKNEAWGPGSLYQIDATVADVYLVSRFNRRWIIGRPVVYVVIDVFSRMVVGLYVGLEGPSWIGAMMALANAMGDKVKYCQEYGIEISSYEWPAHHAPLAILGDRGELISKTAEIMIEFLDIKVKNTPPYRPDWKGIVERHFRTINEQVKPFIPGQVVPKKRGGKDYRLDAKLDLYEFTKIIILSTLKHNKQHYLGHYERDEDMIEDDVQPIARKLWDWGIENRSGQRRVFTDDIVKLNLMPRGDARVTYRGITFKNIHYSCKTAIQDHWFTKAREKTWKLDISYDPRNMSNIYIRNPDGRGFETCFLLERHEKFSDRTLEEIKYLQQYERLQKKNSQEEELQGDMDLNSEIELIVKQASAKTEAEQYPNESKRSRVSGIGNKRKWDKTKNREEEAFRLGEQAKLNKPPSSKKEEPDNYGDNQAYSRRLRLLQKKAEEAKNDE